HACTLPIHKSKRRCQNNLTQVHCMHHDRSIEICPDARQARPGRRVPLLLPSRNPIAEVSRGRLQRTARGHLACASLVVGGASSPSEKPWILGIHSEVRYSLGTRRGPGRRLHGSCPLISRLHLVSH